MAMDADAQGMASRAMAEQVGRLRPSVREVATFGDSRTAQNHESAAYTDGVLNHAYKKNAGIGANLEILTRQRIRCPADLNFGVSGDTTRQMLARVGAVAASRAQIVIMLGGTNDALGTSDPDGALTPDQSIANVTTMLTRLKAAGKLVILISELPRGDGSIATGYTTAQMDGFLRYREFLRADVPGLFPNVIVVEAYKSLANYSNATGRALDGMLRDGLHLAPAGAYYVAKAIQPVIEGLFDEPLDLFCTAGSLYSADNPKGNLAGGAMTGTSGTKTTGGTATMTGNVASNWVLANSAPVQEGTVAVTASKVNRTNAQGTVIGEWQQVALAGDTSATSTQFITFTRNLTGANLSPGDIVEAIGEIEWDADLVGVRSVFLGLNVSTVYESRSFDPLDATTPLATGIAMSGVHRTDQVLIPSDYAGGTVSLRAVIHLQQSHTGLAGTIRFGNFGARKL